LTLKLTDIAVLTTQYASVGLLTSSFFKVGSDISKLARLIGIVDSQGRISPVLSIDEKTGEIKYGQPADVRAIAGVVVDTVKTFVGNLNFGFEDAQGMYNAKKIFGVLSSITDPINTFVKMLTGYESGGSGDSATLAPISVDGNGKVTIGKAVIVKDIASNIANTVTTFISTIFSQDNVDSWSAMLRGDGSYGSFGRARRRRKALEQMTGIFATIIEPITNFVDIITSFEAMDGKIRRLEFNDDGSIKNGPFVDVNSIATSISTAFSTFASTVLNKDYSGAKKIDESFLDNINAVVDITKYIADIKGENLTKNSQQIHQMFTAFTDIIKKTSPEITGFDEKVVLLKEHIVEFDAALRDEDKKRKNSIDELKNSIESLMNVFKDENDNISNLSTLINILNNMNKDKVKENATELRKALGSVGSINSGESNNSYADVQATTISIDYVAIQTAVANAIDGMTMTKTSTVDNNDRVIMETYDFSPAN
jgi:hypothetical protein